MPKLSFNIFDELSAWGKTLPGWQRCLLAKLVGAPTLSDDDLDFVFRQYLIDQELADLEGPRPDWELVLPTFPADMHAAATTLSSIDAVEGVNALVEDQTLTFGPQLTVIYGPNAAGKSGYARVLKSACFTRSKETRILGNVRLDKHKQRKPKATFAFDDGATTEFVYGEACPRLRDSFAVFDASCVRVHLDKRNTFQVMPYLFDVFPNMVEAFGTLQRKLRDEIIRRSHPADKFAIKDSDSAVARLLLTLTAQLDLKSLKELAVFGKDEVTRLEDVTRRLAELRSTDPKEIIRKNVQRIGDLESTKVFVASLAANVNSKVLQDITVATVRVRQLTEKSAALSAAQFGQEPVQPIGTSAWRDLLSAAVAYNQEAYPGSAYPSKATGARCVLCHQLLDPESSDRLARFYQVIVSDNEAQLMRAKSALDGYMGKLRRLNMDFFGPGSAARRTLNELDATLEEDIVSYVETCRGAIDVLDEDAKSLNDPEQPAVPDDDLSRQIGAIGDRLKVENDSLRQKDQKALINSLSAEERLLLDRKWISGCYDEIAAAVLDLQWVASATACSRAFSSTQREVTTKQKVLLKKLVAHGFMERFAKNCAELELELPVEIRFMGDAGNTDRQIELADARVDGIDPSEVLSEGEQTAGALADFLAEIEINGNCAGLIFDDPVTSMDHIRKAAIARRLVDEANRRQIIIFTHDIMFTDYLATAAHETGVKFSGRTVWLGDNSEPGAIDRLAFPHEAYEGHAYDQAKKHLGTAKVHTGDKQRDALEKACGKLRTAYEEFIQKKLFGNVVRRWRENISYTLDKVYFDHDIAARVQERLETLSRYIDGHSHSLGFSEVPLTIDVVVDEIGEFDRIKGDYIAARKAWENAKPSAGHTFT